MTLRLVAFPWQGSWCLALFAKDRQKGPSPRGSLANESPSELVWQFKHLNSFFLQNCLHFRENQFCLYFRRPLQHYSLVKLHSRSLSLPSKHIPSWMWLCSPNWIFSSIQELPRGWSCRETVLCLLPLQHDSHFGVGLAILCQPLNRGQDAARNHGFSQ